MASLASAATPKATARRPGRAAAAIMAMQIARPLENAQTDSHASRERSAGPPDEPAALPEAVFPLVPQDASSILKLL